MTKHPTIVDDTWKNSAIERPFPLIPCKVALCDKTILRYPNYLNPYTNRWLWKSSQGDIGYWKEIDVK